MLPRNYRLLAEKDFSKLFRSGRNFSGEYLGMKASRNGLEQTRIGFAIGTKVAKRAVVRNLLKRRLREILRKTLPHLPTGFDLIIMAKPRSPELSFSELEQAVTALLIRSGIIKRS